MRDRNAPTILLSGILMLIFSFQLCLAQQKSLRIVPAQEKALYQRLGGYDVIAAVVDDFIARLASDAQLARFFMGHSLDSKKRIRQRIVEQLCVAAGGPCFYTGRTMKASHEGLGITESDWQIALQHLTASLVKFSVPRKEREEVLAAVASLKPEVITPQ